MNHFFQSKSVGKACSVWELALLIFICPSAIAQFTVRLVCSATSSNGCSGTLQGSTMEFDTLATCQAVLPGVQCQLSDCPAACGQCAVTVTQATCVSGIPTGITGSLNATPTTSSLVPGVGGIDRLTGAAHGFGKSDVFGPENGRASFSDHYSLDETRFKDELTYRLETLKEATLTDTKNRHTSVLGQLRDQVASTPSIYYEDEFLMVAQIRTGTSHRGWAIAQVPTAAVATKKLETRSMASKESEIESIARQACVNWAAARYSSEKDCIEWLSERM